jgi:zinc protease
MSDLDAMTPDDARDFFRRWYVPANAAVVVAGDVDVAKVRRWSRSTTAASPRARARAQAARGAAQAASAASSSRRRPSRPTWSLAFKVPQLEAFDAADNDDALALTVLAAVLDGYRARASTAP